MNRLKKMGAHNIIKAYVLGLMLWVYSFTQVPDGWRTPSVLLLIAASSALLLLLFFGGVGGSWDDRKESNGQSNRGLGTKSMGTVKVILLYVIGVAPWLFLAPALIDRYLVPWMFVLIFGSVLVIFFAIFRGLGSSWKDK